MLKAYIINESVTVQLALEGGFSLEVAFDGFKVRLHRGVRHRVRQHA